MTETVSTPQTPSALAEPTSPVTARWVSLLMLANLAIWMGLLTPIQVLLPNQVGEIDPANKVTMLGWVTGAGALAAMLANPIAGALSDRTAGRFGRRHPWTLLGGLLGAAGLVLLSQQQTILGVALCWLFSVLPLRVRLRRARREVAGAARVPAGPND